MELSWWNFLHIVVLNYYDNTVSQVLALSPLYSLCITLKLWQSPMYSCTHICMTFHQSLVFAYFTWFQIQCIATHTLSSTTVHFDMPLSSNCLLHLDKPCLLYFHVHNLFQATVNLTLALFALCSFKIWQMACIIFITNTALLYYCFYLYCTLSLPSSYWKWGIMLMRGSCIF